MADVSDTGDVEPVAGVPPPPDMPPPGMPPAYAPPPYLPPSEPSRPPRDRRRLLRRALGVAVVLALLAAGGVIANAQYQQHQRDVKHQQLLSDQQRYLDAVRGLDRRIATDIAPVLHVLDAMSSPRAGDVLAARDAFANRPLVQALRRDYSDVVSLRVPPGWKGHATDLEQAAKQMRDAVNGLYTDRSSDDFEFLNSDIQGSQGGRLNSGVDDWRQAMLSLFVERKEKAPSAVANAAQAHVAPTLTTWGFAVDRACIAGNLHAAPLVRQQRAGDRSTSILRKEADVIQRIGTSIRKVTPPKREATAIRRDILSHLPLLFTEAKLIRQEADYIDAGELEPLRRDLDRLRTATGGMPVLATAFRKYHLIPCAGSVGSAKKPSVQA